MPHKLNLKEQIVIVYRPLEQLAMADNFNSEISKYLVPGLVSCASVVGVVKVLQKLGLIYRVFHPVSLLSPIYKNYCDILYKLF